MNNAVVLGSTPSAEDVVQTQNSTVLFNTVRALPPEDLIGVDTTVSACSMWKHEYHYKCWTVFVNMCHLNLTENFGQILIFLIE